MRSGSLYVPRESAQHAIPRRAAAHVRSAGRPKGSRALTLLAPTGERMAFYEAAHRYDKKALRVIASILMDEKQPASLRLAAANDLLDRAYGRQPVVIDAAMRETSLRKII